MFLHAADQACGVHILDGIYSEVAILFHFLYAH